MVRYGGVALLFVVLLAPLPLWARYDGQHKATSPGCGFASGGSLPVTQHATFKLTDPNAGTTHTIAFGRSRGTRTTTLDLSPVGAASPSATSATSSGVSAKPLPNNENLVAVVTGPFTRSDGETLDPRLIYTNAQVEGGQVTLTVCARRVNRANPTENLGEPGSYAGTVSIAGTDVVRSDVPMAVTLAYPAWQLVLELVVLTLMPAAWYLWILHGASSSQGSAVAWALLSYCVSRVGFLSLAVGAIAAFSVYSATYLSSATWGVAALQPLALYGAMFTACVAAAGGVHLASKASPPKPSSSTGTVGNGVSE